jgi:3-oxoacyl-(acyl-carrier-protein) synthase
LSSTIEQPERVLISGLGPVTPLGFGAAELAESITEMHVTRAEEGAAEPGLPGGGNIPEFDLRQFLDTQRPYLDPNSRSALAAGALALDSGAVEYDEVDPGRCGLASATTLGNVETQRAFEDMVDEKGPRLASPVIFSHSYANTTNSLMSIEFGLAGYNQNFCGRPSCGAQALEAAFMALRDGDADLVLAGGADVAGLELMARAGVGAGANPRLFSQAAGYLLLETQDSLERREGYAFCELGSACCVTPGDDDSVEGLAGALREAIDRVLEESGLWAGDVGMIHLCGGGVFGDSFRLAEKAALSSFTQVPVHTIKRFIGETLAASFPLECILAADMLGNGFALPRVSFMGRKAGVEFWVEREPEPMLGHASLVVGCDSGLAAAACLLAL